MRGLLEICALFFTIVHAYENLSRRNTTVITQSSTYDKNVASLANDGVLKTTLDLCGYTNPGKSKAWLQVDLGQPFSITRVKVYYRKEGNGPNDWKQYRFRQFYLDVSNLPATEAATAHRKRCYTDNTKYPHLPPNVIDISCKHVVRYVIVETTYDAPEDRYTGAMLEVCEIEVYGCSIGYFGDDCKLCSDCYMCDIDNGTCLCNLERIGPNCPKECSHFCQDGCNVDTGTCYDCINGKFLESCTKTCGAGCVNGCDGYRGNCTCKPGWKGMACDVQVMTFSTDQLFWYITAIISGVSLLLISLLLFRCNKKKILTTQNPPPDTTNKSAERKEEGNSENQYICKCGTRWFLSRVVSIR